MKSGSTIANIAIYGAVILALIVFLGPIVWFGLVAIRPAETISSAPSFAPFVPDWSSFNYTFIEPGTNRSQLLNSLVVALGAVALNLPLALPAAYALSRLRPGGTDGILMWYLGLMMAPPVAFLIPYSILANWIGLRGGYASMIIIMQTVTIPFSVWLLKSFFDEVPKSIEEAARVDGARAMAIILKIVIPLVRPGIIVTSMFAFVFSWNNAAFPLILSSQKTATLPVGTLNYFGTAGVTWGFIAAAALAAMLPPMLIFLILDRFVVRGLTFGSVKG